MKKLMTYCSGRVLIYVHLSFYRALRVLEELTDFITYPTFCYIGQTDHKLVWVSLRLVNRFSLAGFWKFNTSSLEIQDYRDRLESLIQQAIVGAVAGHHHHHVMPPVRINLILSRNPSLSSIAPVGLQGYILYRH